MGCKFVENNAQIQFGNDKPIVLTKLKNPVKKEKIKKVAVKAPNTASPATIGVIIVGVVLLVLGGVSVLSRYGIINLKK